MKELETYTSRDALSEAISGLVADRLRALISTQGTARLAVPGGTTPGPMLTRLGQAELPWEDVRVTLTDERWVPASSERSNQRLLSETLFAGHGAEAIFAPLYSGAPEPALGIQAISDGLEQTVLPLDIAVLGMGGDMHTASLFPGAVGLAEALAPDAPAALVISAPGATEPRITLSARVLNAAERHILITGADKRAALDRAIAINDPLMAPVCAVLQHATIHYAD